MVVDELQLLAGLPIDIGICKVYPTELKEIVEIGEVKYNQYLSTVLFDKKVLQLEQQVDDDDIDIIAAISSYDKNFRDLFLKSISFFIKEDVKLSNNGVFYIDNDKFFTQDLFNNLQLIVKRINYIKDNQEDEIIAGNERAKSFMEKLKKKKEKILKNKKQDINLASIISGVAWKSNNVNIKNIWDLTIYQLYDAYYRLENIDYYNHTVTGIYSGTIDGKKINLNKINWARVLNY